MSKYKYAVWLLWFLSSSCYKEVAIPIVVGFDYEATNSFTVPAEVNFKNTSVGAEKFEWTFEGGEPSTSDQQNPTNILFRRAGTYNIRLVARNFDGVINTIEKKITIDAQLSANFASVVQGNSFAPVVVNFSNLSKGFDKLEWTFEGGNPAKSEQLNPVVTFENGGNHRVSLKVSNSRNSIIKDTILVFEPELTAEFAVKIPKQFEEMEVPATLEFINRSVGNTTNKWTVEGAEINNDKAKDTQIKFTKAGTYTIVLQTENGKKISQSSQTITLKPNKGYAYIKDAELGIFPSRSKIGVFYSTTLRRTFQVTDSLVNLDSREIDLLYFGLNEDFEFNRFLSPDQASLVGLPELKNAQRTIILNPAYVTSGIDFNALDAIKLKNLQISPPNGSQDNFFNKQSSKMILFENSLFKKGVILIKEFINDGEDSRIRVDIKVLK